MGTHSPTWLGPVVCLGRGFVVTSNSSSVWPSLGLAAVGAHIAAQSLDRWYVDCRQSEGCEGSYQIIIDDS